MKKILLFSVITCFSFEVLAGNPEQRDSVKSSSSPEWRFPMPRPAGGVPTHIGDITSPIAFFSADIMQCYAQACLNANITTIDGPPLCTPYLPFSSSDVWQLFCAIKADSGAGGNDSLYYGQPPGLQNDIVSKTHFIINPFDTIYINGKGIVRQTATEPPGQPPVVIFSNANYYPLKDSAWLLTGNPNVGSSDFIGSTNNADLYFKVNNTASGIIDDVNFNTAFGYQAFNTGTGTQNSAFGWGALFSNTTGEYNIGFGALALVHNTSGYDNLGIGHDALAGMVSGTYNVGIGGESMQENTSGSFNIGIGYNVGNVNNGTGNIFIGAEAGDLNTGNNNIVIGYTATAPGSSSSNTISIGNSSDDTVRIYGIENHLYNAAVYIDSNTHFVSYHPAGLLPIQVSEATSGTVASNGAQVLELTGSSASVTLTDPSSPLTGQVWEVTTSQASITLAWTNPGNFYNPSLPAVVTYAVGHRFIFDGTKWLQTR